MAQTAGSSQAAAAVLEGLHSSAPRLVSLPGLEALVSILILGVITYLWYQLSR
jgi:hypothetical protein